MSIDIDLSDIVLNNEPQDFQILNPTVVDKLPDDEKKPFDHSPGFIQWLKDNNVSFLISSYKTANIYFLGSITDPRDGQDKISLWMSNFNRPMGIHATKDTVWISSSGNIWKYKNIGAKPDTTNVGEFDACFIPQSAYFSNDCDSHDLCVDSTGNVYYVSATFCCICQPSETHSFKVFWKPSWISKITSEDRCHLNGMCCRDGKPRYVTAVSLSDSKGAWRNHRVGKGVVYDIVEDKLACTGLSMPHSPRFFNNKLWVLDAGTGWLGYVDFEKKELKKTLWLPGYLRGMSFVGDKYMVVGSSESRHEGTFQGLPLGEELKKRGLEAICGFFVIDMKTWVIVHTFQFHGKSNEIYDVVAVEGVKRGQLIELNDPDGKTLYKVK